MLKSIQTFLNGCPYTENVGFEFSGITGSVSVSDGGHETISEYIGGDRLRKFNFTISVKADYTRDSGSTAYDICESIKAWLLECSLGGALPQLAENQIPQYIELDDSSGSFAENHKTSVKYEIKCRLVYYERR